MIKVIITNTEKIQSEKCEELISHFSPAVTDKIIGTKNEKLKKQRIGAYISLDFLYKSIFGTQKEMPNLDYNEKGKPYFTNCKDVFFSISHDEDYSAVAICDTCRDIGIDIQAMPKNKSRLERVADRFLSVFKRNDFTYNAKKKMKENPSSIKENDISYIFAELGEHGKIEIVEDTVHEFLEKNKADEYEYLTKWTLLEASLKMEGSGFREYENAEKIIKKARQDIKVFVSENKIPYSVAVAVEVK